MVPDWNILFMVSIMPTLHTTVVTKIERLISKDQDTANLIATTIYHSEWLTHPVAFLCDYRDILPDVFEMRSDGEIDVSKAIHENIMNLKFRQYDQFTCPFCGTSLVQDDRNVLCLNIDCIDPANMHNVILSTFRNLVPNISPKIISYLFTSLHMANTNKMSVSAIIDHAIWLTDHGNIDSVYRSHLNTFLDQIGGIRISDLLNACTIIQLSDDLDLAISCYNNSMNEMVDDILCNYTKLKKMVSNNHLYYVLKAVLLANVDVFKSIGRISKIRFKL